MRAAVVEEFKKPWSVKDVPEPKAGPGQVLVRVRACGVCGGDLHLAEGGFPVKTPMTGGHEMVGEVVELGAGVTRLKVGDRVGVSWMQRGCGRCPGCQSHRACFVEPQTWMTVGGGFRELTVAYAEGCTLIPEGVSFEDAAPIFCAGHTVISGIKAGNPKPGERVGILGIGGLGHLGIQISKALGLETVAITRAEGKEAELRAFGADEVVVSGNNPGEALQKKGGVDVLVTTVDHMQTVSQAILGVRPGGRLVMVGIPREPLQIPTHKLLFERVSVTGTVASERAYLIEALGMVAKKKVKPQLELYPLGEINAVLDRLRDGKVRYRALIQPGK